MLGDRQLTADPIETNSKHRWGAGSKKKPSWSQADMLNYIREPRGVREIHSDGFLAIPVSVPSAYECECGFSGLFKSDKCARCERKL